MQVTNSLLEKAMDESQKNEFLIDGFPRNEENRSSFEKQVDFRASAQSVYKYHSAARASPSEKDTKGPNKSEDFRFTSESL